MARDVIKLLFNLFVLSFTMLLDVLLQTWLTGEEEDGQFLISKFSNSVTFSWTGVNIFSTSIRETTGQRVEALLKCNVDHTGKLCVKYRIIMLIKQWLWLMGQFEFCNSNSRGNVLWSRNHHISTECIKTIFWGFTSATDVTALILVF